MSTASALRSKTICRTDVVGECLSPTHANPKPTEGIIYSLQAAVLFKRPNQGTYQVETGIDL